MSVNVTLNGTIYAIPTSGDTPSTNWGTNVKSYLVALSTGVLQKAGGDFYLTSQVDFGPSYGIKSLSYSTRAASPATSGNFRLGNLETISWRNFASNGNLDLTVNASDQLTFNGSALQSAITASDTATIDLTLSANTLSAIIVAGSVSNSHIASDAGIDFSKLAALVSGNIVVGSAGNVATSVAMSGQATISNTGAVTLDNAAVIAKVLTGWTPAAGTITASDTLLSGMQKLSGNIGLALTNPMSGFGDLIYGAASGVATRLPASTAGYILQTNGVGFAPTWVSTNPGAWATFTPTLSLAGGSGTLPQFTNNVGRYLHLSKIVFCEIELYTATGAAGSGSGTLRVALPVTASANVDTQPYIASGFVYSSTQGQVNVGLKFTASQAYVDLYYYWDTPGLTAITCADLADGNRRVIAKFFYEVDSSGGGLGGGGGGGSLTDGHIYVGNASNIATDVALTGVIAITNAGVSSFVAGSIDNAAVSASAAIARTKLASGTASHVLINDGAGVMTSEAALSPARGGTGVANNALATLTRVGNFDLALTLTAGTALTLPTSGTLLTTTAAQVITAKDYDGGTASDTSRFTLSKNTTGNLTALTRKQGNLFYDTTLAQPVIDTGSALVPLSTGATRTWYTTVFTASGTWTKATLNPLVVKVTVIGSGGGGGGCSAWVSGKNSGEGAGGGGGGCAIRTIQASSLGATETVTIGAAGTAGNTSGTNGGSGGTSSFGTWATATGGAGGVGMTSNNGSTQNGSGSNVLGGQGGIGASGDLNFRGDDGGSGTCWVNYYQIGNAANANFGGGSHMAGRRRPVPTGGTGNAGYSYGGGGAGGHGSIGTGRAGGVGATGVVIVEEFA